MVCLIKSKYKEELDLYTQLLGSEKRAYAILCCNNGYTLDKTKDGKPSKLYNDLLEYYKGDVTKAVQKKAQLFTSEFTNDYGQWYQDGYEISDEYKDVFDENGEPILFKSGKRVELTKSGISEEAQQKLNNANSFIKNHLQIKSGPIRNKIIGHNLQTLDNYIEWLYYDITGQDLNLNTDEDIYDQIEFAINNTDFESSAKEYLKSLKDSQVKPDSAQTTIQKSLIDSFLSDPDLSKYSEEQKQILKKFLPALFRSEDSLTNKRIGFYKHNIKKIHDKIDKSLDQEWQTYFANRGKQIKLQNFLDYLELSPDYKQQIKEKIFSEIGRYVARNDSKYFQSKNRKESLLSYSERGYGKKVQSVDFSKYFDDSTFKVSKNNRIIYGKAKTSNVLQKIINDGSVDPRLRKSAEFLLKYVKDNQNFDIIFTDPGDRTLFEEGSETRTALGVNDTMSRTIYIRTANVYDNKEHVLIHEIAHSLTTAALYEQQMDNTKIWKGLENYIQYISRKAGSSLTGLVYDNYWQKNPQEFVAEFFGNAEFQDMLKEIPPVDQNKFNNIFEELLNWLYELFTGKPTNAFEQIKPVMESLVISQADRDLIDNVHVREQNYLESPHFGIESNKILLDEQKEFASVEEEEQYILDHAKRDENGKLLAPNGKPSNLTEKQYVQVRTKAFKEWFGDWENDPENASKIVDENGEPLVVYRGDAAGKTTFEAKPASYNVTGIYLAGITEMVQRYVEPSYYNDYKEGEIYQLFVNARNPFIGENRDVDDWNNGKLNEYDAWIYGRFPKGNGELVVRNSEQIKSATDNVGTFSRTNKDIRYNRNNDPASSSISQNNQQVTREEALEVFQRLQSIIPSLKEIKFLSNEETLRMTGGVRANAFVKNGIVYVNEAGFNSKDTVIEECLHSFVNDLSTENKRLFNSLLRRATKDFPKLVILILENYSDKDGFTQEDRNQELVTQVLSRYMRKELENPSKSLLRNIQNFITWLVEKLQKLFKSPKTGKRIIDANSFINGMTFEDIAKVLNSNNVQLNIHGNNQTKYNRNSKKRIQEAKKKVKAKLKEGIYIVGTRDATQKLIDELSQNIILGTRSKNKSYSSKRNSSVSYGNERQIARNQEAANFVDEQAKTINEAIAERDAEKQLTEQAKLILDFVDHADSDINEVLQMLKNAQDNDYDLIYYNVDQFGNRLYQDPSGNSITAQTAGNNTVAKQFSFDDIQYMTTDILGYYQKLLTDIDNMLLQVPVGKNEIVDEIRDLMQSLNLHDQLRAASNMKRQAQEKMLDFYIDQRINQQESSELTDEMKQRLAINMKKWVKSQYDFGDIGSFAVWTQLVSDSKSPIVRMMADEIYKMNQEIDSAVVPRGEELEKALKEAESEMSILGNHHPVNVMTMLMQKDRRGYYNGDFVQPINRRQYFSDLEEFKTSLLYGKHGLQDELKKRIGDDFELELDEYGEPIIPTDPKFDDIYKDYKRKMETFICDHANRRFTKEYYLSRIDTLSPTTLRILDQFSRKISNLKNSATVDGKFRPDLLSSKQRAELAQLQKDRQELSNPYDQFGELKDPDSIEGIVSKELNDWQDVINGEIKYKSDVEAFNECLNNIQSQAEKDQFKRMFAHVGLNPNMYNFLAKYEYIGQNDAVRQLLDEISELRKKLRKLIGINKDRSSYLGYNWEQLFDIRTGEIKNEKLLAEIRNVDDQLQLKSQMLRNIRESDKEDKDTFGDKWQLISGVSYGRLFTQMYYGSVNIDPTQSSTQTVYSPNNDTVYEIVRNNYISYLTSKGMSTQDATDKASQMLTIGHNTPLSIFMVQMPSSKTFKYEDENGVEHNEPSYVWIPNQLFSKVDTENSSSRFINKHFDESSGESVQPKEEDYRDERYYEMIKHPKLNDLYNKLVKGMQDVYSMLPYSGKYDMRLPQMGANTAAMLTRNLTNDYGFHFASNLRSVFNRFANATEIDTDYYIPEYNRRPDGSTIKNIPIRYINRIDDSRNISSDLAGGVIAMLKMATNYNVKSKHISKFESILNSIKENDVGESNQSRVVEGMLDRLMYENQNNTKKNKDVEDISKIRRIFIGGPKTLLKRLGIARGASTLINLAGRGVSMIVSFLDPLLSTFIESLTGRYYGAHDLMCGLFDTCREFPLMLASISRRKSFSKTMAIIDALGMEKSVEHRFSNMHHSSIRRLFSDNLMMKGFEVGDYTIKAFNVNSIFRTYRIYTDSNGQVSFLNKYDYIQHCIQDGMSKKEAAKAYKSARNARSYLYVKNGSLALKNGMTEDQFRKLGNAAKKVSQNITLMANTEDKTWMQTNPWTAFITMLRTFMLVGFGERFKNFNDFIVGTDERYNPVTGEVITDISDRNLTSREIKQQKKQHYYRGGYNFMTGHIESGIYISNIRALKRLIWDAQKHRIRFNRFFLKYGNMTQEELKKSDISMAELYSLKRILLELSVVAGCVTMSVLVNRYCQGLDPDDDDNYWWFLLNSVLMRIGIERVTMYNPQTVSDLITSITTLTSATSKLFGALDVLGDFLGLTDHDPNEIITSNSAYHGYTRSYRATMNALSIFGTAGWFATMPKSLGGGGARALDKSAGWYAKTAPWRLLYKNQDAGKHNRRGMQNTDSMDYGSMGGESMDYGTME